jgi:hypothetical protein
MSTEHNNRRSFRISESAYLRVETITDDEFRAGLDHRKLMLGTNDGAQTKLLEINARLGEAMYMLNSESDQIGRCLTLLNDKLNVVIGQLPSLREAQLAIAKLPPQTIEISADGLVFSSERPMRVGEKLHLTFLLSKDNAFFETFAEVIRQTAPVDTSRPERAHGVAVSFHGLSPEQRETLIQHMFNVESDTLRMRRLQLDGDLPGS